MKNSKQQTQDIATAKNTTARFKRRICILFNQAMELK